MSVPLLMVGVPTVLTTNTTTALPASSTLISFQSAAGSTIEASNDGSTWGTLATSAANVVVSVFTAAVFIRTATANTTVTAKATTTRSQAQFLAGNGSAASPSYSFLNDPTIGFFRVSANVVGFATGGVVRELFNSSTSFQLGSTVPLTWTPTVDASGAAADTGISRTSPGILFVGNGTQGDATGVLQALTLRAGANISTSNNGSFSWNAETKSRISSTSDGIMNMSNVAATIGSVVKVDALPTIASGFGGTPAVTAGSTPFAGSVNVGTGGVATSGVINFNGTAFPSAPFVVCMNTTTGAVVRATATTTQLTITAPVAFAANDVIAWICISSK